MEWRDKLTTARASALQLRLLDHLFEMPVLTIPIAARILGVTYASAKRNIEKLTDAGVLKYVQGTSYPKLYAARRLFDVMG